MNDLAHNITPAAAIVPAADPMINLIERVMTSPDADLDKLERMLAMKERMDEKNAQIAFSRAISMARAEIPPIVKESTVDFTNKSGQRTNYQYETLASIARVIDPILSKFGLSYRFRTPQTNSGVTVVCIISHADGYCEETALTCSPDTSGNKNPFQAVGSAVTYLQRYTLKAALGLSAEVDDDAQSAAPRQYRQAVQPSAGPSIGDRRTADTMIAAIKQHGANAINDPRFNADLTGLRQRAPELAAMVEVEVEAFNRKSQPITGEILDDKIPY